MSTSTGFRLGPYKASATADHQPYLDRMTLRFTSGANGAVPVAGISAFTKKLGFTNCVRNSTGNYTATLDAQWAGLDSGDGDVFQTGGGYDASLAAKVKVIAFDLAAKTVTFVTIRPDTGAVIDPASGDVVNLNLTMCAQTLNLQV